MRYMTTMEPMIELQRMMESLDRAFGAMWENREASRRDNELSMPMDIYEHDNAVFVRALVPGISPDDLEVNLDDNVLTIRGESKSEWESESDAKVYRRETRSGRFVRSIRLPEGLNHEEIDAEVDNGVVTVRIPNLDHVASKNRRIPLRKGSTLDALMTKPAVAESTNGRKKELTSVGSSK